MQGIDTINSLESQREEFCRRRFLAMPLAGMLCWTSAGIANFFLSPAAATWMLFIATGSIFYVALLIAHFSGENLLRKNNNPFDRLFFQGIVMALLLYAIAIPFFLIEPRSLPFTLGILTGVIWLPFSWIVQHWIGTLHAVSRTLLLVIAWYVFPNHVFVVIPAIIVVIYAISIGVLEQRWRAHQAGAIA